MMQRSFVDPVSYVRTVYVEDAGSSQETLDSLSSALDKARALDAWRAQQPASTGLVFDEAFRYWLGLRLPYLYRHAARGLRDEVTAFRMLSLASGDWREWSVDLPILHVLDHDWRVEMRADGCAAIVEADGARDEATREIGWISSTRLADTLTAVVRFRVHSPVHLWLSRAAFLRARGHDDAARAVIDTVVAVLHDGELAMRALCPLIAASFATSSPVVAFIGFLNRLGGVAGSDHFALWRQQPEPSRWGEVFDRFRRDWRAGDDGEPCDLLDMATSLEEAPAHPFLTDRAREWAARADGEAAYAWFLEQAPWAPRHITEAVWRDFQPPASLYCFQLPARARRVFFTVDRAGSDAADESISVDDAQDLVVMHGLIQRAAGVSRVDANRTCGHTACPEYRANYCSTYPVIPRDYRRCAFPVRAAQLRRAVVVHSEAQPA